MNDDKPRKSWKEIDRQRDGSSSRREDRPPSGPRRQRSQKSYRAALDRLFDSGKIGKLVNDASNGEKGDSAIKLRKQVLQAEDRTAITKAVDAYLAQYPLPRDAEVLAKVLEHRESSRQLEALQLLSQLGEQEFPSRRRGLIGQLKLVRDTSDEQEAVQLATTLLERLDQ